VCWRRPKVYTYIRNFMWMCSLCWLPVAQNHNFGQILTLGGAPVPIPFYRQGPNFSAACARAEPWCTLRAKFRLDRFILPPSGSDKTLIFPFFGLRHFVVSPIAGNRIKLNTGAQLQTKASKSFTPSWRNRAHKLWRSKAWRTNTHKNSTFFAAPAAGEFRYPPNLASVNVW